MKKFGAGLVTGAMLGGVAGAMLDKKCKGKKCGSTTFRSIGAVIDSIMK